MEKMFKKINSEETRDMFNIHNSVVRRTLDFLFGKMGYVRKSVMESEIEDLKRRLLGEEKKVSSFRNGEYYYKTNYLKVKEENKVYVELFSEIGEKQMGLDKKVVTIKVPKKSKKTTKRVVGMKTGNKRGPYDKSDKSLVVKHIEGQTRTNKFGTTYSVRPFDNSFWVTDDKKVS